MLRIGIELLCPNPTKEYYLTMSYCSFYQSPIGEMILLSDGISLIGLRLKDGFTALEGFNENPELSVFASTRKWLDEYFAGAQPKLLPPISFEGSSSFQKVVYALTMEIPYGFVATYGNLAKGIGKRTGRQSSPRSVGQALNKNPILLIVPCHRVLGAKRDLVGYAAGLDKKRFLLEMEQRGNDSLK